MAAWYLVQKCLLQFTIWPVSGEVIIFHSPGIPWNKKMSVLKLPFRLFGWGGRLSDLTMIFNQMYIFYYLLSIFFKDSWRQLPCGQGLNIFQNVCNHQAAYITLNEYLISSPENLTSFHKVALLTIIKLFQYFAFFIFLRWRFQRSLAWPATRWTLAHKNHHWPATVPKMDQGPENSNMFGEATTEIMVFFGASKQKIVGITESRPLGVATTIAKTGWCEPSPTLLRPFVETKWSSRLQ